MDKSKDPSRTGGVEHGNCIPQRCSEPVIPGDVQEHFAVRPEPAYNVGRKPMSSNFPFKARQLNLDAALQATRCCVTVARTASAGMTPDFTAASRYLATGNAEARIR